MPPRWTWRLTYRWLVFAATDVHYLDSGAARAALVLAEMAAFEVIAAERLVVIPEVDEYEPGAFFRRELPCLRAVLAGVADVSLLAKSRFATATHAVPVIRGGATRPLYVTAAGMPTREAAEMVRAMAGPHRLPDALRRVDQLARGT
jgi:deoxyribonuclease V